MKEILRNSWYPGIGLQLIKLQASSGTENRPHYDNR